MKTSIKSIVSLVCICSVIALALAFTNYVTKPIIEKNENAAANEMLLVVMPDGEGFEKIDTSDYTLPSTVTDVYKVSNGGYVFKLLTTGYSSGFSIMCGVNADGTVSGAVCLSSTETLGYEKTYGDGLVGKNTTDIETVDTVSGATKTTSAYRSAVKDALNAAVILGGGSVDLRTEEEILAENLAAALPEANGEFTKYFFVEIIDGFDAIYTANNEAGFVFVKDEQFIAASKEGTVLTEGVDAAIAESISEAAKTIAATTKTAIDLSTYEELPAALISAEKTASGNYVLELRASGFGINGDQWYNPSGEYIYIRVSLTAEGKIIDCLTVSQSETANIGGACADESFYGQFDGKTEENYKEIDAISGATLTTNGYKTAILRAFEAVKIFEGGKEE